MIVLSGIAFFTLISIGFGLRTRSVLFKASGPKFKTDEAPGIGFDLTPSYGTVAIRYANGSFDDVTQVPFYYLEDDRELAGQPESYPHMMRHLSEFKEL